MTRLEELDQDKLLDWHYFHEQRREILTLLQTRRYNVMPFLTAYLHECERRGLPNHARVMRGYLGREEG